MSWFLCAISFHVLETFCRLSQLLSSQVVGRLVGQAVGQVVGQASGLPVPGASGSAILVVSEPPANSSRNHLPSSIFHLPSSIFHLPPSRLVVEFSEFSESFQRILFTEFSDSFSCILSSESSESFSCILSSESSESFSCILYTESSEFWTAAALVRMVDDMRVTRNNDSNAMLPIFKSMDSQWRVQETPTSLINPPALRATTSQESTVLFISKPLRGYLRGNTPYSSGCRAWLFALNPFHFKGFHRAASRFRAFLNSSRPPLRHTLLATLVVHTVKAS